MKNLVFTLVSLFILFAIGCQENLIGPNTQDSFNKPNTNSGIKIIQGEIPLGGIVLDPSVPGIEYYNINGIIFYDHRLLNRHSPVAKVALSLLFRATLERFGETYVISAETEDTLYVNEFGYKLEKLIFIPELNETFCFGFLVTSESIILSERCFEFPPNDSSN